MSAQELLLEIHRRVVEAGGSALLVGGCVRDQFLGVEPSDYDLEVYGLPMDALIKALVGLRTDIVGKAFGIVKVGNVDVSVPRRENKIGVGHREFDVQPDSSMTPKEAAARRDFTMNSLAQTLDGEVLDFYNGIQDIQKRVLRATSEQFAEDPLRVLRGMQFAARFGMQMEELTLRMCRSMASEFSSLPTERLWGEFEKLMEKGRYISRGLSILQEAGWLPLFPELAVLDGCPQDPEWHPEGDVWRHTKHVCDTAAEIADRDGLEKDGRLVLLFAALAHDFGKPKTTVKNERGRWTSPDHHNEGVAPTQKFLASIGTPVSVVEAVAPLVREHMLHVFCEPTERVVRRLAVRLGSVAVEDWSRLVEADHSGRPPLPPGNPVKPFTELAQKMGIGTKKPAPLLMGRHLIENFGLDPSPRFGRILKEAFEIQLDQGWTEINQALQWAASRLDD